MRILSILNSQIKSLSMNCVYRNYLLSSLFAVIFTYGFHELGHWFAYTLMGYDASYTITTVKLLDVESVLTKRELFFQNIAGPLFTLLQVFIFYNIMTINKIKLLYTFVMTPFIFRFLAGIVFFNQAVDEGSISILLGWGSTIGFILMLSILGIFCYKAIKNNHITKQMNLLSLLVALGVIGILYFI